MIISESAILLTAERHYQETYEQRQSLTAWKNGQGGRTGQANGLGHGRFGQVRAAANLPPVDRLSISHDGSARPRHISGNAEEIDEEQKPLAELKIRILRALIEKLTGKRIKVVDPGEVVAEKMKEAEMEAAETGDHFRHDPAREQTAGYGLIYEYHASYREVETTSFAAEGIVTTQDGMEISFSTSISMSREFMSETNLSVRAGDALKDPLVVNFNGNGAELSEHHFDFDIDVDGTLDQVQFVGPGSGFLGVDHNGDGVITDGSELFGPTTGNGFEELRSYDDDGNGWIDELDDIYDKLRIWILDSAGNRSLFSLGQKEVGAVYLGHITTPFSVKDSENNLQAQVRSSGMYISENGQMGTIQQVDLVV